jgi:hypothetical protein
MTELQKGLAAGMYGRVDRPVFAQQWLKKSSCLIDDLLPNSFWTSRPKIALVTLSSWTYSTRVFEASSVTGTYLVGQGSSLGLVV